MSLTQSPRTSNGVALPEVGDYAIDPSHSSVGFVVKHLMFSKVRGEFTDFDGTVHIAEDPTASSVEVAIRATSIDTHDTGRDEHLRGEDFFDATQHSELTFRSTSVREAGEGRWSVDGDLTIRGTTKPVNLDLELNGLATDPWGNSRALYSASTEVNREDFGLTWNQALEAGGVLVGKSVRIELEVATVKQ